MSFSGSDFLTIFVLPNLYFHISTAYGLLRKHRINVGKMDYVGPPPAQHTHPRCPVLEHQIALAHK